MEKKLLNYRVVVEKENVGKNKYIYNAYCPALGIADYGNTIDLAIKRITDLIQFHIESLIQEGHEIPVEKDVTTLITSVEVTSSPNAKYSQV